MRPLEPVRIETRETSIETAATTAGDLIAERIVDDLLGMRGKPMPVTHGDRDSGFERAARCRNRPLVPLHPQHQTPTDAKAE